MDEHMDEPLDDVEPMDIDDDDEIIEMDIDDHDR